ncbi:MAG: archease [Thermoplasmata archaeon]|nr:archease [Thermoplasmata archaeon]
MGSDRIGRRYGSFGTTADVGLWASARTPAGLFEALGLALFARMTDRRSIRPTGHRTVRAAGRDPASLVVAFLSELVVLHDSEGFLVREVTIRLTGSPPRSLTATLTGEPFDGLRHSRHMEVKAVTLHRLSISLDPPRARVILDI